MKLFIWVQHLFGLGHVRRMARIAAASAADGIEVTVAAGGPGGREVFRHLTNVRTHQLPPLRTKDHQYTGLLTGADEAPDEPFWARRREALLGALRESAPDILLTELFPFGRRKFASEVMALIEAARALPSNPLIVSSVRDIVEPKEDPKKAAQMAGWLNDHFDAVLVHGDEQVIPLSATAPFVADTRVPIIYTGYIAPEANANQERSGVVVSAGSGASGAALLGAAAKVAEAHARPARPWDIFVPDAVAAPTAKNEHVRIHSFTDEFTAYLARAEISIGEAGYNTCAEALALGTRPVLVPYEDAAQTEQPARARAFAAAGVAIHLPPRELTPAHLARAVEAAIALPASQSLNLSGAKHTAVILKRLREQANAS